MNKLKPQPRGTKVLGQRPRPLPLIGSKEPEAPNSARTPRRRKVAEKTDDDLDSLCGSLPSATAEANERPLPALRTRTINLEEAFYGAGGSLDKAVQLRRQRNRLRELGQTLASSMQEVFPKELWQTLNIELPQELDVNGAAEARKLAQLASKEREIHQAASELRQMTVGGRVVIPASLADTDNKKKRTKRISFESLRDDLKLELQDGRLLATLAQTSGWLICDIEEVRDVYMKYALASGSTVIVVRSPVFTSMLQELYTNISENDVNKILSMLRGFGTRGSVTMESLTLPQTPQARNSMSGTFSPVSSPTASTSETVSFSVFFAAFARWIDGQLPLVAATRCTVRKFADQRPDWVPTAMQKLIAVQYFQRELQRIHGPEDIDEEDSSSLTGSPWQSIWDRMSQTRVSETP